MTCQLWHLDNREVLVNGDCRNPANFQWSNFLDILTGTSTGEFILFYCKATALI